METANTYAKETIINNKQIDQGLFNKINSKIQEIPEKQRQVIQECNLKIEKYKEMYNQLFIYETKQLARNYTKEIN